MTRVDSDHYNAVSDEDLAEVERFFEDAAEEFRKAAAKAGAKHAARVAAKSLAPAPARVATAVSKATAERSLVDLIAGK